MSKSVWKHLSASGGGLTVLALIFTAALCLLSVGSTGWVWLGVFSAIALFAFIVPACILMTLNVRLTPPSGPLTAGQASVWIIESKRCFPFPALGVRLRVNQNEIALPTYSLRSGTRRVELLLPHRGRIRKDDLRLVCSFPFELWTLSRSIRLDRDIIVRPGGVAVEIKFCTSAAARDTLIGTRASAQGDILGIREYVRGDAPRQIAWPATARLGRLMSRQCGAAGECRIGVDLDEAAFVGSAGGETSGYEYAIRSAASLISAWKPASGSLVVRFGNHSYQVTQKSHAEATLDALAELPSCPTATCSPGVPLAGVWTILLTGTQEVPASGYATVIQFADEITAEAKTNSTTKQNCVKTREQWVDALRRIGERVPGHAY